MDKEAFISRLIQLRTNKGVSAREMSLSIGQSPNYINSIETGRNLPSLTQFFYICEYLGITPEEFFDVKNVNPTKLTELYNTAKGLTYDQLEHIIAIIKDIKSSPNKP